MGLRTVRDDLGMVVSPVSFPIESSVISLVAYVALHHQNIGTLYADRNH
jgi:hypothetical protein